MVKARRMSRMEKKDIRENEDLKYVLCDENHHESSFTAGNKIFCVQNPTLA